MKNTDQWASRRLIEKSLSQFNLNIFHWMLLSLSCLWVERGRPLPSIVFHNISFDNSWYWRDVYVPETTLEVLCTSDAELFRLGLLEFVDESIAHAMIHERSQVDSHTEPVESLVGNRIFTSLGYLIWSTVEEVLRGEVRPVLTGEVVGGIEVHHNGLQFDVAQCCAECAVGHCPPGTGAVEAVGPWYSRYYNRLMPRGWRLICPHGARPAGFMKRTIA